MTCIKTDKITIFTNKEPEKAVAFSDRLQDAYAKNNMTVIAMRTPPNDKPVGAGRSDVVHLVKRLG